MPTTHTTPIDLRGFHGREYEAIIGEEVLTNVKGKISVNQRGNVYLCQNERVGSEAQDKLGFKYSWIVQLKGDNVFDEKKLNSITILDPPSSIDPRWDWKDGEIVIRQQKEQYKVCRIHNDIVIFIRDGGATGAYEIEEAYKSGYRKLPSPPTRKLTEITEEMFDKTNLIGRKVEYEDVEYTITGMNIGCGNRFVVLPGVPFHTIIHKCKLIEE